MTNVRLAPLDDQDVLMVLGVLYLFFILYIFLVSSGRTELSSSVLSVDSGDSDGTRHEVLTSSDVDTDRERTPSLTAWSPPSVKPGERRAP